MCHTKQILCQLMSEIKIYQLAQTFNTKFSHWKIIIFQKQIYLHILWNLPHTFWSDKHLKTLNKNLHQKSLRCTIDQATNKVNNYIVNVNIHTYWRLKIVYMYVHACTLFWTTIVFWGYCVLFHFKQYFGYIVAISFISGGKRSARENHRPVALTNFIT